MTPNDIEILIHCHTSSADHPRKGAPAVVLAFRGLEKNGLIEWCDRECYHTTDRGVAHVQVLCSTPWPEKAWVDQNGNVIGACHTQKEAP